MSPSWRTAQAVESSVFHSELLTDNKPAARDRLGRRGRGAERAFEFIESAWGRRAAGRTPARRFIGREFLTVLLAFACGNLFAADLLTGGGKKFKAVLLSSAQSNSRELRRFVQAGYNTAVLYLTDEDSRKATKTATERILTTGLDLYYWIEIARNPA